MSDRKFEYGDRVRHTRRPEWGVGSIVKTEEMTVNGLRTQRVSVRFPNAGLKILSTAHAELRLVTDDGAADSHGQEHPLGDWQKFDESDWLGDVARRKVDEAMVSVAPEVRDPFNSLRQRLGACLDLYRFERTGRSLIDWAVAQSTLEDPLTRFTRHELELLFDQWATQRENQLDKLLQKAKGEPELVKELLGSAPSAAQKAVRRLTADR